MLANRIRKVADKEGLTIKDLAKQLDMNQATLQRQVAGNNKPGYEFFLAMHKHGIDINWLLSGEGEMYRKDTPSTDETSEKTLAQAVCAWIHSYTDGISPEEISVLEGDIARNFPEFERYVIAHGLSESPVFDEEISKVYKMLNANGQRIFKEHIERMAAKDMPDWKPADL